METTNLYCGIYDAKGKLLTKKLFHVENGITSGTLILNPSFGSGEFIIKAHTNWMNNFKEDDAFVERIYVLNKHITSVDHTQNQYSIHISPEGGQLITNVINTIGFKIESTILTTKKVKQGTLINDKGEIILKNIKSNNDGIGKFVMTPKPNHSYFLKIELDNGEVLKKNLPKPKEIGINISVNNLFNDKVFITLRTNANTFEKIKYETLYLANHRDGMIGVQRLLFDKPEKTIFIPKETLLPGINIITLFDEKSNPILERLIFNQYQFDSIRIDPKIQVINKTKDSVEIEIGLKSKNAELGSLSISILPEDSKAYTDDKSIISNFLLLPYLKTPTNNLSTFLKNIGHYKLNELDVILLAHGWSRYKWEHIFKEPPMKKFDFERGIDIKGTVLNDIDPLNDQIVIYQPSSGNFITTNITADKKFELKNQYLLKKEVLNIGIIDGKSLKNKPSIQLDFFPKVQKDSIILAAFNPNHFHFRNTSPEDSSAFEIIDNENIINLESVIISQRKKVAKLTRNPKLISSIFEGKKIDTTDIKKYVRLSNLIRRLGFRISSNAVNGTFSILPKTTGHYPPIVIIDDFRVESYNVNDMLLNSLDEIYYENFGMYGSNGGTIYIYQKHGRSMTRDQKKMVKKISLEGYEKPEIYFNPKLNSNIDKTFTNFGHIHWVPNITLGNGKNKYITFPHYNLKSAKILIEGFTQDGKLISTTKLIEFN
ncbi:hypothetical protein U6A24_10065 [Aquimarina gracilis]|uniref:TonB-dependent receptor-like protein n=1 Tax=Aquimarina gracilis TaxID=874422 RepID=A0ABU5ZUV9_9FLAO|nr:hypothetical protein [Aquimarina gracilis]MEB3345808.1 hypothetical protein [Aquimarina gracilis]